MGTVHTDHELPVWAVFVDVIGPLLTITLTYHRLLPDGTTVKFDEDPSCPLDLLADADDALVRDGFLALIPDGELLSCALRERRAFLLWDRERVRHIPADNDTAVVAAAFAERLFNTDGASPDALFVGSSPGAHTTLAITAAWGKLRTLLRRPDLLVPNAWSSLLSTYRAILYTDSTEVRMVTWAEHSDRERLTLTLATVAERYGLRLP